jgi:hypothetical protein
MVNPTKTTKRGIDDTEEITGVYVDFTNNTCPESAPGEMGRGITQDPLTIPRAFRPPAFPKQPSNNIISQDSRNLQAQ